MLLKITSTPEQVQLLGEIERIRIHAEGREQLGANRDNFGVHG
jgi:hypothetical protein